MKCKKCGSYNIEVKTWARNFFKCLLCSYEWIEESIEDFVKDYNFKH